MRCWMILNKLAFGDNVSCPLCLSAMKANYLHKYVWCSFCRKKYRPTSFKGSWLYGMKLNPRQLFILLWAWQNKKSPDTARHNRPSLLDSPINYVPEVLFHLG